MLARLILPIECLVAYFPTVRAGQIIFDCEVAITVIGRSPITSSTTRIMGLEGWVEVEEA